MQQVAQDWTGHQGGDGGVVGDEGHYWDDH